MSAATPRGQLNLVCIMKKRRSRKETGLVPDAMVEQTCYHRKPMQR